MNEDLEEATQLKPSSVPHRNLNQQGRASTAHLNTPSSTLSLTKMPMPTNACVTQKGRASTAQLVLSLTHVPATQSKPSSEPHRNLNQQVRASTAHLNTPSSTLSLTQVPAAHLKPPSSTQVPVTHSNFEGNLNEDLDEGQVGGFGIDPNDVPGIPENVFY